jgi:hypothetical protein
MTLQIAKSVIDGLPYNHAEELERFRQAKLARRFTGDVAPSAPRSASTSRVEWLHLKSEQ